MKNIFLTEGGWSGKINRSHPDMRNDSAWMYIFDALHTSIYTYKNVRGFDNVFIMFPKGFLTLNMIGVKISNTPNPVSSLLSENIVQYLKQYNKNVYYIQEGPCYLFNDYEVSDQFNFYNLLAEVDGIFAHNEFDKKFYKGFFPNKSVETLPPVMITDLIAYIQPIPENKVIIGGNFARWYGGFQSYVISDVFNCEKWIQTSHATRQEEPHIPDLNQLPRLNWENWMKTLSTFKYAINLMPTAAAGTFSMNCAYFGIPCIGNIKIDTQKICFPELSVDVDDVESAYNLANKLVNDSDFYEMCSTQSRKRFIDFYDESVFRKNNKKFID
jgi:hypothetical protein